MILHINVPLLILMVRLKVFFLLFKVLIGMEQQVMTQKSRPQAANMSRVDKEQGVFHCFWCWHPAAEC